MSPKGRAGRPVTNAELAKIEVRRHQVAAMLLEGRTYREIGEASGVSPATIAEDVKHVREEWKARNAEDFSDLLAFECAKSDRLEARLWPEINRGRPWAFEAFVKISRRRGRLLGLETPEKFSGVVYHHKQPQLPDDGGRTLVDFATDLRARMRAEQRSLGNGAR
jgi:hypothetical protein